MAIGWGKDRQNMEIHTVGYSSKMLKNKLLAFAVSDMNLKSIVQSEKFRHEKIHIEWFHLHEMSKKKKRATL